MPNWCENNLKILSGDKKEIDKMRKAVRGKDSVISFEKILPTPTELLKQEVPIRNKKLSKKLAKKYGMPDWYEWRVKNWGTKWDLGDEWNEKCYEKWYLSSKGITFDTAWAPPIPLFIYLSKQYPSIEFKLTYVESGMCFAGYMIIKAGKIIDEEETQDFVTPLYKDIYNELCGDYDECYLKQNK